MTTQQIEALRDLSSETLYDMLRDNLSSLETLQMKRSKREARDRAELIYAALLWNGQTPAEIATAAPMVSLI
jgi:hypothetical protein